VHELKKAESKKIDETETTSKKKKKDKDVEGTKSEKEMGRGKGEGKKRGKKRGRQAKGPTFAGVGGIKRPQVRVVLTSWGGGNSGLKDQAKWGVGEKGECMEGLEVTWQGQECGNIKKEKDSE